MEVYDVMWIFCVWKFDIQTVQKSFCMNIFLWFANVFHVEFYTGVLLLAQQVLY